MRITTKQLRRIIKEEKARLAAESRYMSSHEEKAAAGGIDADSVIDELESLLDLNYHVFSDTESGIIEQALEIISKLRG